MSDDEEMPEIATNPDWRGIMVRARKTKGFTQVQLGEKVGLSQAAISKIEDGTYPSSAYILRICRALTIPEPQHFVDEDSRAWSQLGHTLRHLSPEAYDAAMKLVEQTVRGLERAPNADESVTNATDRRK